MEGITYLFLNAMTVASILMVVGLGLAIIYGLMELINFAHGEFVTIGAYTLVAADLLGGSFWMALLCAPIVGALFGILMERVLIRYLYDRPLAVILATWGVSLIIRQGIQLTFGAKGFGVSDPLVGTMSIVGVEYPVYRLFLIVTALSIMATCYLIIRYTRFGLDVRTVIQDREMAACMGINTRRINLMAFSAGSALAAIGGVLIAPLGNVLPHLGLGYLAKSFFVVIVGGVGNIAGVAAGSCLIGGLETFFNYHIPVSLSQALVLILAIVIVRYRPQGIIPK